METIMEKKTQLRKSIKLYLSKKLKKVAVLTLKSSITPSKLRSACKYPKTPSFDKQDPDSNHHTINQAAMLSDTDRVLSENFQSLSINDNHTSFTSIVTKRTKMHENLGNIASTSSTTSPLTAAYTSVRKVGVEIRTLSMDPYEDFRSSIKKIVEAHHRDASQPLDWDFMWGLVSCYQQLNDKSLHKHVLRASTEVASRFRPSRRTVPVSMRRQKAVDREELLDSPCSYSPADFPEDFDNEQIK
ncbi:transcription repressor OFP14-like protein [Carex littledalei]|uniref:Transcription repressor OFP14-like protein n=1 Tax=Carex littledalei TaxID=544730 RepID=A0A833VFQ7_9POAL|nr:transcription repressor OFP14-like protein [Carex littledalei]